MRALPLLVLVPLLTLGPHADAEARQCVVPPKIDDLFRSHDVIFIGTVLSNTPVPGPEDGVQNIGVLRAEQFWKARPSRRSASAPICRSRLVNVTSCSPAANRCRPPSRARRRNRWTRPRRSDCGCRVAQVARQADG